MSRDGEHICPTSIADVAECFKPQVSGKATNAQQSCIILLLLHHAVTKPPVMDDGDPFELDTPRDELKRPEHGADP